MSLFRSLITQAKEIALSNDSQLGNQPSTVIDEAGMTPVEKMSQKKPEKVSLRQ